MNQSNQITAVPLRQAHSRPAAHLTVVPGTQSEFPAPFTAGWARRFAKAVGMPPAEIPHFYGLGLQLPGVARPVPSAPPGGPVRARAWLPALADLDAATGAAAAAIADPSVQPCGRRAGRPAGRGDAHRLPAAGPMRPRPSLRRGYECMTASGGGCPDVHHRDLVPAR